MDPSIRALSGRHKFTIRRHQFNKDSLHDSNGSGHVRRASQGTGRGEHADPRARRGLPQPRAALVHVRAHGQLPHKAVNLLF